MDTMDTMDTFLIIILGKLIPHASSFEIPKRSLIPYKFFGCPGVQVSMLKKRLIFSCFCHPFLMDFSRIKPRLFFPESLVQPISTDPINHAKNSRKSTRQAQHLQLQSSDFRLDAFTHTFTLSPRLHAQSTGTDIHAAIGDADVRTIGVHTARISR